MATGDPGSETALEARNLLAAIDQKEVERSGPKALAERQMVGTIESRFAPATEHMQAARFDAGLGRLLEVTEFLESEQFEKLTEIIGDKRGLEVRTEYARGIRALLIGYAEALEKRVTKAEVELNLLNELKITKSPLDKIRKANDRADRLLTLTDPERRRGNIDTVERIEVRLEGGRRKITERLYRVDDTLDGIHEKATIHYHQTRAVLKKNELFEAFKTAKLSLNELKNKGELEKGLRVCEGFLERCQELKDVRPASHYEAVVEELLGKEGLKLDEKMRTELDSLNRIVEAIDEANALEAEGRYEDANALRRKLLRESLFVNFQKLIRLVVWVRTRPVGAEVWVGWDQDEEKLVGVTTDQGLLVRYPPYGKTVIILRKASFEEVRIEIEDFTQEVAASQIIDLRKVPKWKQKAGGAIESTPVIWRESVLVPNRDGHLRAFGKETGEPAFDHDTGLLSGLSAAAVVRDDIAYIASRESLLLAFDLTKREVRWKFDAGQSLRTSPLVVGRTVVVGDESGTVYGLREGREIWRRSLKGRIQGNPSASKRSVCFGTTEGLVYCLDPATGDVNWERDLGGPVYSDLACDGVGRLFVGTETSDLVALALDDGAVQWRFKADNAVRGQPALSDGIVHIATLGGTVYRVSAATGNEVDRVELPGKSSVSSGVALGKDAFYVVSNEGVLFAIAPVRGILWTFETGSRIAVPSVVLSGRIYVTTEGGDVFCLLE
ncbi:MAG: outer membrane protein assembly factor BamB family protein [Planctomycetota bacterium]